MFVTTPLCKKIRFDIAQTCQDDNMNSYQARINRAIGYPRSTRVLLPMECIGTMQNTLKVLEEDYQQQCTNIEELKIQITEQNSRIKDLEQMNQQRLRMMKANILTNFVKKICPKLHVPSTSSQNPLGHEFTWLALDPASIDWKKLLKADIDLKYIDILKNFSWVNWAPEVWGKDC